MISNCAHDENGRYTGGRAGDQNSEWIIRSWYNRPWDCVLVYPEKRVRTMISDFAIMGANNNHIGYNQNDRLSFERELEKVSNPSEITKDCNTDCSASTIAIIRAVGRALNIDKLKNFNREFKYQYTGTIRQAAINAGFRVYTTHKYTGSEKYIEHGYILLNDEHHVAIDVGNGKLQSNYNKEKTIVTESKTPQYKESGYSLYDVKYGDRGEVVKFLQTLLMAEGVYNGEIDGIAGNLTIKAIADYQVRLKTVTCGHGTWKQLISDNK